MTALEQEVKEAVSTLLRHSTFPVWETDDDRGLTEDEYIDFAMAVIRKMRLAD